MVSVLLKAGADVEAVDSKGDRAIVWACKHAKVYSVQSLLKAGSKVTRHERDRSSPVLYASQTGHIGLLEDLLQHGGSLDCQNIEWQGPLMMAAKYNRANMVRHLIQTHFKDQLDLKDRNGSTAHMVASLQSAALAVRVLLDAGADVNAANSNGDTALLLGVCQDNYEYRDVESTLSLLIGRGANIHHENAAGNNALILAAEHGNLSAVKMLLEHGARVHMVNLFGSNAATMAARGGFTETAKAILAAGLLQPEASDSDSIFVSGGNAVISAAHAQHNDTAEQLYSQLLDNFCTD
jgi:ankyrin repeat protein